MDNKQLLDVNNKFSETQVIEVNFFSPTYMLILPRVWKTIFSFVDVWTLLNIRFINKAWYAVEYPVEMVDLPCRLFEHYNSQIPHPFKDGGLFHAFCEAFEKQDIQLEGFSESLQNQCFQSFMTHRFSVQVGDLETLLQYIQRLSAQFQQQVPLISYITKIELQACTEYVTKQLSNAESRITFLLDHEHLQHFLQCYDRLTQQVKGTIKSDDYLFLAKYLQKLERLEAFLTILVLFAKMTPYKSENHNQMIRYLGYKPWSGMLAGDGFVVLELSNTIPGLLEDIVKIWRASKTNSEDRGATEYILTKLRVCDLLIHIQIIRGDTIKDAVLKDAVLAKQPQIIALLSSGTIASNLALAHVLDRFFYTQEFFDAIVDIPSLVACIQTSAFLNCLFQSAITTQKKIWFAETMLARSQFVVALALTDIILLIRYLNSYNSYIAAPEKLTKILVTLFEANRLTGSLLIELTKLRLDEPRYAGRYALIISSNEQARVLLSKYQNTLYAFEIAKIALLGYFSGDEFCPLLTDEIMKNFTPDQIKSLYGMAKPINRRLLEQYILPEKPILHFPFPPKMQPGSFSSPQEHLVDLENNLAAENEHKRLAVAIVAFWVLAGLALVITGGALGGLGMITAPTMITLLTIGGFLLISFIAINCILKMRSTLDDTDSQSSFSDSSSDDDSPILSYNNTPTNPVIHAIQNAAAAYINVLSPESQPLIENKVNFCGPSGTNRQNEYKNS